MPDNKYTREEWDVPEWMCKVRTVPSGGDTMQEYITLHTYEGVLLSVNEEAVDQYGPYANHLPATIAEMGTYGWKLASTASYAVGYTDYIFSRQKILQPDAYAQDGQENNMDPTRTKLIDSLIFVAAANWPARNIGAEQTIIDINQKLVDLLFQGIETDSARHKQWCFEQMAEALEIELPDHEPGVAP